MAWTPDPNLKDRKPTVNGLLDWASYMTGTHPRPRCPSSSDIPLLASKIPQYLATFLPPGLSGGSWLIGASAQNNHATTDTLRSKIWKAPQIIPSLTDFGFSYANLALDFAAKTPPSPTWRLSSIYGPGSLATVSFPAASPLRRHSFVIS